jgi:hypothetical protein
MSALSILCRLHLVAEGLLDMSSLPHAEGLLRAVLLNLTHEYLIYRNEVKLRYDLRALRHPVQHLGWLLRARISPLRARYLSIATQGAILINARSVCRQFKELTDLYGVFRQLCDQLYDIEEDAVMGRVSVPLLYGLIAGPKRLGPCLERLWRHELQGPAKRGKRRQLASKVRELTLALGGAERAYSLAVRYYAKLKRLEGTCWGCPGFGHDLQRLIRLKRASLERIKVNKWISDAGQYY